MNYLRDLKDLEILPGVPQAMKALRKAGFKLVVVTNQSGVPRGYLTLRTLRALHRELARRLAREGARWDALYFAPYLPDSGHPWRKPGIGMLEAAQERLNLDLSRSYIVGDRRSDIKCGRDAGCAGAVLVLTGAGRRYKGPKPHAVRRNLLSAARWILSQKVTK